MTDGWRSLCSAQIVTIGKTHTLAIWKALLQKKVGTAKNISDKRRQRSITLEHETLFRKSMSFPVMVATTYLLKIVAQTALEGPQNILGNSLLRTAQKVVFHLLRHHIPSLSMNMLCQVILSGLAVPCEVFSTTMEVLNLAESNFVTSTTIFEPIG